MRFLKFGPFLASALLLALDPAAAKRSIRTDRLLEEIKILASDEYEGRAPASHGEELTVQYLADRFKSLGLKPGNPNGTWTQDVPLFGILSSGTSSVEVGGQQFTLAPKLDSVTWSLRPEVDIQVKNSDVVFVGYGVVAPEFGWDDYKGVDVRGKTIVMLINDPPVPDPGNPLQLDPEMFKGKAMTYYGRWTYKYEIASRKGAAAAVIVHETGPAGYPFQVISGSNSQENFDIQSPDRNRSLVQVQSWITRSTADRIFAAGGQDFAALKKAAVRKDFRPVTLNAKWSFNLHNQVREVRSKNVVAKLEGSDPKLRDEYVVYTAHWDHIGKNPSLEGDQIYNGAVDNATGCAGLVELARAYSQLTPAPKRSILFLSVTAEEKGLLGSKYYAANPLYPLTKTLADINMDMMNVWGRTRDVMVTGLGSSTLDEIAKTVADAQGGRTIQPDPLPERGRFYRSDHFEFAKQGVPAFDLHAGVDYIGKPSNFGSDKVDEYNANDYHKVSDEPKPGWDLSGAVEDLQLVFDLGLRVANGTRYPEWMPGAEFKAKRDRDMAVTK